MRVVHFYHVWAEGAWAPAVSEHHEALIAAGFPVMPAVGVTGPDADRRIFGLWAADHGWQVIAEAGVGYEQVTLRALRAWALAGDEPAAVLYAHAKGAMTDLHGFNSTWRRTMTGRLVGEWQEVVPLLARHDAVGCCWKNKLEFPQLLSSFGGSGIFAGNFWWATRDYLRGLPKPATATRHDAEAWIGLGSPDVVDMLPSWLLHMTGDGSVVTARYQEAPQGV